MSYHRCQEDKRRLRKLYNKTKNDWGSGVWYDDKKKRYIRIYLSNVSGHSKYWRRVSNKKVRKTKILLRYNQYKKVFDYWWTLY